MNVCKVCTKYSFRNNQILSIANADINKLHTVNYNSAIDLYHAYVSNARTLKANLSLSFIRSQAYNNYGNRRLIKLYSTIKPQTYSTYKYTVYLEVIEWLFSYGPLYLTLECNIGPRQLPESNIGTSAKREGQYCSRAVVWANIALMS